MHAHRLSRSPSTRFLALGAAALCTALQLAVVTMLAEYQAPAGAQMVQLERVVVSGKRVAAAEAPQRLAACETPDAQRC